VFRMEAILCWVAVDNNIPRSVVGSRVNRDGNTVVLQRVGTSFLDAPPDYWERARVELQVQDLSEREGYNLMLHVVVYGKDRRFWQGLFGSKVADISVRVLGTAEELADVLNPETQQIGLQRQHLQERGLQNEARGGVPPTRQDDTNRAATVNNDGNNNSIALRMFWDFVVPALCFIIFAWLAQDGDTNSVHSRRGY